MTDHDLYEIIEYRDYERNADLQVKLKTPGYIAATDNEAAQLLTKALAQNPSWLVSEAATDSTEEGNEQPN